jgi:NADPH:quinone reductase-like Zn-dependent oxidoreductase
MRALVLTGFGGPEVFTWTKVEVPKPGPGQLLVRVLGTSANPLDYQTRRGDYRDELALPAVIGSDVSGVVVAVGLGVREFAIGDEVFYLPPPFTGGSFAEFHAVDETIAARKPRNLSHQEAGVLPCAGGTAWESLIERGRLRAGETVLIHAAAGGVGSLAVQIARAAGATVFATCSARSRDFVAGLGPDRVIDYRNEDVLDVIRQEADGGGVELIFDTVGGDTIERSPYALRAGGRIVSIVDIAQPQSLLEAWNRNAELHFVFTPPRRATLDRLRVLLESGGVRPLIDSVLPLEEAPAALARLEAGGVRGKVALVPPSGGDPGPETSR